MILYYIVFLMSIISFVLPRKIGKLLSWMAFALMFIMTFYRDSTVGTDTINYLIYSDDHRQSEYIVNFISTLMVSGILDDRGIICITSLVTYFFSGLCVWNYKIDIKYFVLFFFLGNIFVMGMNISRQIAAVSIIAYFVPFINSCNTKKSLLFFVGIALAYGFHYSSVFCVLLYPILRYLDIKKQTLGIMMVLFSPLLLFNIIPVDSIMRSFIPKEYNSYSTVLSRNLEVSLLGYVYRLLLVFLQYKLLYTIKDPKLCILFVLGVLSSNIGIGMDSNVSRIFLIYSFLLVIIYSHIGGITKNGIREKWPLLLLIVLSTFFCFVGIQSNPDLNNYKFYK